MERDPGAGREPEPVQPEDATPDTDAEELPDDSGTLPDTGHVVEEKGVERTGERGGGAG